MNGKYAGQIVQWDERRKFGFILAEETLPFGDERIFVHHSNCTDTPFLGAHCQFEIGNSFRLNLRPQAVRVTMLEVPESPDPISAVVEQIGASKAGV